MYQIINQQVFPPPKRNLLLLLLSLFLPPPPSSSFPHLELLPPERGVKAKRVILKPVDLDAGGRLCDVTKCFITLTVFPQACQVLAFKEYFWVLMIL